MKRLRGRSTGRAGAACAVLVAVLATTVGGASSATETKPDLVVQFPSTPYATQKAPFYVDTYVEPGHVMYRFDSVLFNKGGVLDIYRDPTTGHILQAVWAGGTPSVAPDPNSPPPADAAGLSLEDLTAHGATFKYIAGPDHNHFHFENAAIYELVVPAFGALKSAKIGFCFGDDFGAPPAAYFPYPYTGPGMSWCAVGHPEATFFREGISPQAGDLYNSQIQFQWVDVTGVRAGTYSLRGIVNPSHLFDEASYDNNVTTQKRVIPGVIAGSATVAAVAAKQIKLSAAIVGGDIPARSSSNCFPRSGSSACLVTDTGKPQLRFALTGHACFGTVHLKRTGASTLIASYRPPSHGTAIDGFSYTATDARGLQSLPGIVRIGHASATGTPKACLLGGSVGPDLRARLTIITSGKAPAGTHWALFVNSQLAPGRVTSKSATSVPLTPGLTNFWVELVKRDGSTLSPRVQSREMKLEVPAPNAAPG